MPTPKNPAPEQQQLFTIDDGYQDLIGLAKRPVVSAFTAERKASKGDVVAGTVVSEEWISTTFGPAVRTLLETNPDPASPLVAFVWLGTVLDHAYRRLGVGTGSRIAAVCQGEVATGKYDSGYMDWNVQADNSGRSAMLPGVAPLDSGTLPPADPAEEDF